MSNTAPSLVDIYYHKTQSELLSGVLRVFFDGFGRDFPFHEHPSRNGQLIVSLHAVEFDAEHLGALLAAIREEEIRLAKERADRTE